MPTENKHIDYTAEDLLRYAQGNMSTVERHALEKAALEDVFLSEAIDGYVLSMDNLPMDNGLLSLNKEKMVSEHEQIATGNISQLDDLRKIIADKAADKKEEKRVPVVSILRSKWLQTAVAAMFLFGVSWWLFSVLNSQPKTSVVASNMESKDKTAKSEPSFQVQDSIMKISPKAVPPMVVDNVTVKKAMIETRQNKAVENKVVDNNAVLQGKMAGMQMDTITSTKDVVQSEKKVIVPSAPIAGAVEKSVQNLNEVNVIGYGTQKKREFVANNKTIVTKPPSYVFQGRILDNNNNPLPYSSVLVPGENVGTYSNSSGYFNFIYTDSILPVRAKSLGFEPQNFNMHSSEKENKIVLNEDKNFDKEIVFFKKTKQNSINSLKPIIKVDSTIFSAEPKIGWNNYDLYLSNNNRISDLPMYDRNVQLSFEVDKNGEAQNITIEKSQGTDLDKEAIRLVKEGPKWNAKAKTGKGKVVVKF